MEDRSIRLDSVRNIRDLGGLTAADGRRVRPGLLIRSANLSEAAEPDLRALAERWRVSLVVDLRTTSEREQMPDGRIPGADYAPESIFDSRVVGISHEKQSEAERIPRVPDMAPVYRKMAADPGCRAGLGGAARRVMAHDFAAGSVLWHCSEGKDRCGLLTAVLLSVLGVDRGQIMDDYLLTNLVNEARSVRFAQELLDRGYSAEDAENVRKGLLARPEYLQASFDAVDGEFGGTERYLREALGLEPELLDRFRAAVLE